MAKMKPNFCKQNGLDKKSKRLSLTGSLATLRVS